MARPCSPCNIRCADGRSFDGYPPSQESWSGQGGIGQELFQCCYQRQRELCGIKDFHTAPQGKGELGAGSPLGGGRPSPAKGGFRGADGKLLEGKQEVLGMEVPKILIVAGVAVAAYFIVKKMK